MSMQCGFMEGMLKRVNSLQIKTLARLFMLLSMSMLAMPWPALALTATTLGDYDNVTVMQVSGSYDVTYINGSPDMSARRTIAKEFYRTHGDDYDMLVIFTNFDFVMPPAAKAFYSPARNDIHGIGVQLAGLELFDYTNAYSPTGTYLARLNGTIDMANLASHVMEPTDPEFDDTLMTLTHEFLHRWGAYVHFMDGTVESNALLGSADAHWSFLLDSGGSTLYGNNWRDNGDGTFTAIAPEQARAGELTGRIFSPLDLYLMGLIDKTQVPPLLLIDAPGVDRTRLPAIGETIAGVAKTVTIDDIVASEGERIPNAANSRKEFRLAFIYAVTPGTWSAGDAQARGEVAAINRVQLEWEKRFSILTDGVALMRTTFVIPEPRDTNPGVPTPTDPPAVTPSVNNGISWLVSRQQPGGFWQDQPGTEQRDTAAAVSALKVFPAGSTVVAAGQAWLGTVNSENSDFLARKLLGLNSASIADLVSRQNTDGGWGVAPGYSSNPVDTALVLQALATHDGVGSGVLTAAIGYLHGKQNPDGGWNAGRGGSMVQSTARALLALNSYRGSYPLEPVIADGLVWLTARQNGDGGFGNSPSTVIDTAVALEALKAAGSSPTAAGNAVNYLLAKQTSTGSWGDSAFQTAQAVAALYAGQVAVDLAVEAADISISPYPINSVPSDATVYVKVKNAGDALLDQVKVVLFKGDPSLNVIAGQRIVSVAGHATTDVGFSVHFAEIGNTMYYASVDPDGLIFEISEFNNVASKEFYVGPPPPTVGFSISTSSGSESQTSVNLTVSLAYAWNEVLAIDYRAATTGTATAGTDYILTPGTLNFEPGETSKSITINVVNDQMLENNETIVCELYNPQNAFHGNSKHTYTIHDNDQPPIVQVGPLFQSGYENTASATMSVFLSFAWDRDVTVDYFYTTMTTATFGTDFIYSQGSLCIPAGQSSGIINLTILDDKIPEEFEQIFIKIENPVNAILGEYTTSRYDLADNDVVPTVKIVSPVNGQTYNTRNPAFSYNTSGVIKRVEVYVDGVYRQDYAPIGPLSYGTHQIMINVYNINDVKTSDEVTFFVDDNGLPPDMALNKVGYGFENVFIGEDGGIYGDAKYDINLNKLWDFGQQVYGIAVKNDNVYINNGYGVQVYKLDGTFKYELSPPVVAYSAKFAVDDLGNTVIFGLYSVDMKGGLSNQYDVVAYKYNKYGRNIGVIRFGSTADENIASVITDKLGNAYVLGTTTGYVGTASGINYGGVDVFIARISPAFNTIVVKQFGTGSNETAYDLGSDNQNNIYAAVATMGSFDGIAPAYDTDAVLIKLNVNLDLSWIHQEHSLRNYIKLFVGSDDYVYLAGCHAYNDPKYSDRYLVKIIKYDQSGNVVWPLNVFSDNYDQTVNDLFIDKNNNIYITFDYWFPNYSLGYWERQSLLRKYNTGIEFLPKPVVTIAHVDEEPGKTAITLNGTREGEAIVSVEDATGSVIAAVTYPTATTWSCSVSDMTPGIHVFNISATRSNGDSNVVSYEYEVFALTKYSTAWVKQYGTAGNENINNLLFNGDNLQAYGETNGVMSTEEAGSDYDLFVFKTDVNGNQFSSSLQIDATGNHLVDFPIDSAVDASGNTYLLWSNYDKGIVAKYNVGGVEVWRSYIDSRVKNTPTALTIDVQGNVYVVGNTNASLNREIFGGGYDYFVVKFNDLGTRVWTKLSGEPGEVSAYDIAVGNGGTIYLAGREYDGYFHNQPVIYKLNNVGVFLSKGTVVPQNGNATSVVVDNSGDIYIAGHANFMRGTGSDPYIVKMNDSLGLVWERDLENIEANSFSEIRKGMDGRLVAVGDANLNPGRYDGYVDAFMMVLAPNGTPIYSRKFATPATDILTTVLVDDSGNIYMGGNTGGQMGERQIGGSDVFVAKLTPATGPDLTVTEFSSPTKAQSQVVRGVASPGSLVSAVLKDPAGSLATVSPVTQYPDGTWSFTVGNLVANADNVLTVSATDIFGTTCKTVTIAVDNLPPALTISPVTSPTHANIQTVAGTIETGANLSVEVNPPAAAMPVTVTNSVWNYQASLMPGDNLLVLTATDAVGNTTVSTATITCLPPKLMVSPTSIAQGEPAAITLTIEQFDPASPDVRIETIRDVGGDGSPTNDPLIRLFSVRDGVVSNNPSLPGDEDGQANGRIVTTLRFDYLNDVQMASGDYLIMANTSPTVAVASFRVTESGQTQTIQGYVIDLQNTPLSGATVQLLDKWGRNHGYAFTDSAGHYLLSVPKPGEYVLLPTVENFVFAKANLTPHNLSVGQHLSVDLTMLAGTYQVEGQVRESGTTLQVPGGVLVRAENDQYVAAPMTRVYGAYQLDLPAGDYDLFADAISSQGASALGYLGSRGPLTQVKVAAASTANHLSLSKGNTLACGRVVDPANLGVAGLVIEAATDSGSGRFATAVSDSNGDYCLGLIDEGSWRIALNDAADQPLGYVGKAVSGIMAGNGPLSGIDLAVFPIESVIEGVVSEDGAQPVAAMVVRAICAASGAVVIGRTATDGSYRLGVHAGIWQVAIAAEALGYNPLDPLLITAPTSSSVGWNFVVTKPAPSVSVTVDPVVSPTTQPSQTLRGSRSTNATLTVAVDTAATVGVVDYPTATTWQCTINNLIQGPNVVTVSVTDGATQFTTPVVTIDYQPLQMVNTITITKATYDTRKKVLNIEAASNYDNAQLQVAGYGPMTFVNLFKGKYYWNFSRSLPTKPAMVTVLGPEGSQTATVR